MEAHVDRESAERTVDRESGTWFIISDYICLLVSAVTVAHASAFTILLAAFMTLGTFDYISSISFVYEKKDNLTEAKCQFNIFALELSFSLLLNSGRKSHSVWVPIKSAGTPKVTSIFNTFRRHVNRRRWDEFYIQFRPLDFMSLTAIHTLPFFLTFYVLSKLVKQLKMCLLHLCSIFFFVWRQLKSNRSEDNTRCVQDCSQQ